MVRRTQAQIAADLAVAVANATATGTTATDAATGTTSTTTTTGTTYTVARTGTTANAIFTTGTTGATTPIMNKCSLIPATSTDTVIDYSCKTGIDIYKTSTAALPSAFSVEGEGLLTFTEEVKVRSTAYGWDAINKPKTTKETPVILIDQYALISLEYLTTASYSYVNTRSRNVQSSIQMYTYIMASISE